MANENFCVARVETRTRASVGKFERHIERKNESYENMNVDLSRTPMNVQFKGCGEFTYNEYLDQLVAEGKVSLRGLKPDAKVFDEMVLDVNTDFFEQNGGYEYACRFYEEAFHFAEALYGKENIVSAVMHADELNTAMTEKYGRPIYHYHLHIMALPVVDKEVKWTKRCKDPALVGTVKEVIHQVSHSKKWKSEKAVDENGQPILNSKGKSVYRASYSILQDRFFEHMVEAGFTGFQRGERGSTAEHLSVTEYKVKCEQEHLDTITQETQHKEQEAAALGKQIEKIQKQKVAVADVEQIQPKSLPLSSKVVLERSEYESLSTAAKKYIAQEKKESKLQKALDAAHKLIDELKEQIQSLKSEVAALKEELFQYKSIRGKLRTNDLERENEQLRGKVRRYEDTITRHNLWHLFGRGRSKAHDRGDAR